MDTIDTYLDSVAHLLWHIRRDDIRKVGDLLVDAYLTGRQVFLMGNGGSAATASHLACDLQKTIGLTGATPFRVMALTDNVSLITAWANDADYSDIFVRQLAAWVQAGDVVIGISASGSSANVIRAIELANHAGAISVGLSGYQGGRLAQTAQHNIVVPSEDMQQIEDTHMVLAHVIFRYVLEGITD